MKAFIRCLLIAPLALAAAAPAIAQNGLRQFANIQVADAAPSDEVGLAQPYYRLTDVRLRGLLHLLRDDDRLQTFVERELGPLLAHDAQHGTDLVGVLRTYLNAGRNKSVAADAAPLSRPSFYERLHRIERVLQVDLDSVESCLSLHVALLARDAFRR